MRRTTRLLAALGLVLALLVSTQIASAAAPTDKFKAPRPIDLFDAPRAVIGADGTTHVIDVMSGNLLYRAIPRGGAPGAPQTLATNLVFNDETYFPAELAIDASGRLHLLWNGTAPNPAGGSSLVTRYYATLVPGGSLSTPLAVGASSPYGEPIGGLLTVEPNGRAHIAWREFTSADQTILHTTVSGGTLGPVATVASRPLSDGNALDLNAMGVDGAGIAHIAYDQSTLFPASGGDYVRAAAPDGTLGAPVLVVPFVADETNNIIQLLVAPDGTTHIIELSGIDVKTRYFYDVITPAGALAHNGQIIGGPFLGGPPVAALDGLGRLHVLAAEGDEGDAYARLRYAIYEGARRTTLRTLVDEQGVIGTYLIGVGPTNEATLVWDFDKASSTLPSDVYAVRPGSTSKRNISRESSGDEYVIGLAIGPDGGAATFWRINSGSDEVRDATFYATTY